MALELKERQRVHLGVLLKLKRQNSEKNHEVYGLQEAIENAIMGMEAEDVEIMEERTGIKVR